VFRTEYEKLTGRCYVFLFQCRGVERLNGFDQRRLLLGEELSGNGRDADGSWNPALVCSIANTGIRGCSQHFLEQVFLGRLQQGAVDDPGGREVGQARIPALWRRIAGLDAFGLLFELFRTSQSVAVCLGLQNVGVVCAARVRFRENINNLLCYLDSLAQPGHDVLARRPRDVLVRVVFGVGGLHGHGLRPCSLRGEQQQVEESEPLASLCGNPRTSILNIARDIGSGDGGLCSIFGVLGGCTAELLLHDADAARNLGAVGAVVAQQEGGLAELADEFGDVHLGQRRCCLPHRQLQWRVCMWRGTTERKLVPSASHRVVMSLKTFWI
jgi:hypothetical protein